MKIFTKSEKYSTLLAIKKTALQKASKEPSYINIYNTTETA